MTALGGEFMEKGIAKEIILRAHGPGQAKAESMGKCPLQPDVVLLNFGRILRQCRQLRDGSKIWIQ